MCPYVTALGNLSLSGSYFADFAVYNQVLLTAVKKQTIWWIIFRLSINPSALLRFSATPTQLPHTHAPRYLYCLQHKNAHFLNYTSKQKTSNRVKPQTRCDSCDFTYCSDFQRCLSASYSIHFISLIFMSSEAAEFPNKTSAPSALTWSVSSHSTWNRLSALMHLCFPTSLVAAAMIPHTLRRLQVMETSSPSSDGDETSDPCGWFR